jgi:penicillin G amidase
MWEKSRKMKNFCKTTLLVQGIILLVILSGYDVPKQKKNKSEPQYEGEISVSGITDDVTVFRDERGMPHIYAMNEHDLYMAVGYISAQERLWQMDLIRRSTTGHLSEIFGKSFIQTDLFMRSLCIQVKSESVIRNEDPRIIECLKAYTDGVNSYILSGCKKLPVEFRILSYKPDPWTIEDIANIVGFMGWNLGSRNLLSEIYNYRLVKKFGAEKAKQLIPDWKTGDKPVYPEFIINDSLLSEAESFLHSVEMIESLGVFPFSGSNNWALSGKRTETGKPLLSNDMHLTFMSPGIWMQMHHVVPGKINVAGVLIPGEPFIIAGHNEKIAWGMTNMMVDDIDLFSERINPDNFNQYYYNGGWKEMNIRKEIIKIKGGRKDTSLLKFTHRGPVISGFQNVDDAALSMRWSGNYDSDEIRSVYLLNRAAGWTDFRNALSTFRTISQNFVYADTEGNIGLSAGGGIPVRKSNGNLIRDGETDEFDWKGFIPFDQLPYSYNPQNGYVASANNKTVDNDYPYYISTDFFIPYRINRIRQMIDEKEIFGIEDLKKMVLDQHSALAGLVTPFILKLSERFQELTPLEQIALDSLKGWDYDMNTGLIAPSLFEFFRISLRKNLLADELGDLYEKIYYNVGEYYIYRIFTTTPDEWVDDINTEKKETLDDIILESFKDCVASISKNYGHNPEKWKWGNLHKIVIKHPLGSAGILNTFFHFNSGEYSVGGSDHTISPYFSFTSEVKVEHGASERHIFNTADWDESYTVIPTGASGMPGSEFYLSQTKTYINGGFYKDAFSEEAVRAAARYTLKLLPGK